MSRTIHYIFDQKISKYVGGNRDDPCLRSSHVANDREKTSWTFPELGVSIIYNSVSLAVISHDNNIQVMPWNDLLHGNQVRPPLRTLRDAMSTHKFHIMDVSFGHNVGRWSHFTAPGFVVLLAWDSLLVYNSQWLNK